MEKENQPTDSKNIFRFNMEKEKQSKDSKNKFEEKQDSQSLIRKKIKFLIPQKDQTYESMFLSENNFLFENLLGMLLEMNKEHNLNLFSESFTIENIDYIVINNVRYRPSKGIFEFNYSNNVINGISFNKGQEITFFGK